MNMLFFLCSLVLLINTPTVSAMEIEDMLTEKALEQQKKFFPAQALRKLLRAQQPQSIKNIPHHDKFERTALMAAAHEGNIKQMEVLIEAGSNINTRDTLGWTPLMYALNGKNPYASAQVILDAAATGAQGLLYSVLDACNNENRSVYFYASNEKLTKLLTQYQQILQRN